MRVDPEKWLTAQAHCLAPALPVNLNRILSELSVRFSINANLATSDGEVRRCADGTYEIVVKRADLQRPRVRFTIAHELGHVLIDRQLRLRAVTDSEYWNHETWCDAFAARLLVPDRVAATFRCEDPFDSVAEIAKTCCVSWAVAAKRVSESWTAANFVAGNLTKNARKERVVSVRWSAGSRFAAVTPRKHLRPTDDLGAVMLAFADGGDWATTMRERFPDAPVHMLRSGTNLLAFMSDPNAARTHTG